MSSKLGFRDAELLNGDFDKVAPKLVKAFAVMQEAIDYTATGFKLIGKIYAGYDDVMYKLSLYNAAVADIANNPLTEESTKEDAEARSFTCHQLMKKTQELLVFNMGRAEELLKSDW